MLTAYLTAVQDLLSNPAAPTSLYSSSDLTNYINTARLHISGETQCIRAIVNLAVTSASNTYPFSACSNLPSGVQGIYNIRQATYNSGTGQLYMGSRPYPWAVSYWLNNAAPTPGAPSEWAQYALGATGSLIVNPLPSGNFTLNLDVSCQPVILTADLTPEAIPYPATDCVPFLAAYYAYMSSQRQSDANTMLQRYEDFKQRFVKMAVPNVLPLQYDLTLQAARAAAPTQQGGG